MSKTKNVATDTETTVEETTVEEVKTETTNENETVEEVLDKATKEGESTMSSTVPAGKKMNVTRYCQDYEPPEYIQILLKKRYPMKFYTKEVWDEKAEEIRTRVIY